MPAASNSYFKLGHYQNLFTVLPSHEMGVDSTGFRDQTETFDQEAVLTFERTTFVRSFSERAMAMNRIRLILLLTSLLLLCPGAALAQQAYGEVAFVNSG